MTRSGREDFFRKAKAEGIKDAEGKLTRLERDYGIEYELRFTYLGRNLYVKTTCDDDDPTHVELEVASVKKQH